MPIAIRVVSEEQYKTWAAAAASDLSGANRALMASLRRATGAKFGLPAYRWMLEPAMFVLRVEPEMLLKSRWALPGVLQDSGYEFRWPHLDVALEDVAGNLAGKQL